MYSYLKPVVLALMILMIVSCGQEQPLPPEPVIMSLESEEARNIAQEIESSAYGEVQSGLELSLWASDSLTRDPIAISIDPQGGIYYTRAIRMQNSEFDIRGHREWMTKSISWQTVENRRDFLHENFPVFGAGQNEKLQDLNKDGKKNWRDLAVQKEEVWRLSDESGNGYADRAVRYLSDFHTEYTDVANGIEYFDGNVYIGCAPDLWKTKDQDGDGIADEVTSLATGFGVHIGYSGHGMSGVTMGPDGRIYWGIGDIGMNLTDQEGKNWRYPNQGVIVRCETDGSNFEVYSAGLRNTHEFAFDKFGNLISEDNDGDHAGERERLVYLINGSDSGWRSNWQYGKYTDPKNNGYKVWMDEKMSVPHWEGQAAYFLPPITNYVNGPTGFVYNPGTALSEKWKDHFFVSEFRGTPARSPIHAFTLEKSGAGFKLGETQEIVKGFLPTGIDFGPDGAMYFGDWIDGWDAKNLGRIWKIDVPGEASSSIRQETKMLIQADFSEKALEELSELLGHPDMRIRQKAQFEIVTRKEGLTALKKVAQSGENQLERIHALWGIGQLSRKDNSLGKLLTTFLTDSDEEIVCQAIKLLGDIRYENAAEMILSFVNDKNKRLQLLSTEAMGRIGSEVGFSSIIEMIANNEDTDVWLRHAGAIALSRIDKEEALIGLSNHPSKSVRTAAVVALRRMVSPKVKVFLADSDEFIVTETARAINDDYSIPQALPALAELLNTTSFRNEALMRRVLNAHARLGENNNLEALLKYAENPQAPPAMRTEALSIISNWVRPSVLDRVDGRYRGAIEKDSVETFKIVVPKIDNLLTVKSSMIANAAIGIVQSYGMKEKSGLVADLFSASADPEVKVSALEALQSLGFENLSTILKKGIEDKSSVVKAKAISLIPLSGLSDSQAVELISLALQAKDIEVRQAAIHSLATYDDSNALAELEKLISSLEKGDLNPALELDLIEAIEKSKKQPLMTQLDKVFSANEDPLARWVSALEGGDYRKGRRIFNNHAAAQCTRCHTIFEIGGDAGPGLVDVGSRLSNREILESLVEPSAVLAPGYGATSLTLKDQKKVAGIIIKENSDEIVLKVGDVEDSISKNLIQERVDIPSSMPPMKDILTIREIRDLITFLTAQKGVES